MSDYIEWEYTSKQQATIQELRREMEEELVIQAANILGYQYEKGSDFADEFRDFVLYDIC